jgi:hypothetical protein
MNAEHYSLTEAVIEKLTPLRWADEAGALVVDADALQDSGARYARIWLTFAALFLCAAILLGDLVFAASATAKLATMVTAAASVVSLGISAAIAGLRFARR